MKVIGWQISLHWIIYIHLRLHMVAFILTCAIDSICKNSRGTWRYSHPPLLMCITLAVFSYGHVVLPLSSLNCLTIFSYEEPLLSTVVLSSLFWPQNNSSVTGMTDQFWAFSSLHLCRTVFLRHCLSQQYPFEGGWQITPFILPTLAQSVKGYSQSGHSHPVSWPHTVISSPGSISLLSSRRWKQLCGRILRQFCMCSPVSFLWDPTMSVQFIILSVEVFNIFRNIYFCMWLRNPVL